MYLLWLRFKYMRSLRLQIEFGSASKLDFCKSNTRMYLNLKMQEVTNDSLLSPSPISGNEMVLILLFSFPKNLETFSSSTFG